MSEQSKAKIAVIVGSTRDARFGHRVADWFMGVAQARDDLAFELLDLRDFDLPFFNEVASNAWVPTQDAKALAWQKKLAEFDGYVFVTPEYNHSIPASLKNGLDQAYVEWNKKPGAIVAYGSVGGTRAAEHLRAIQVELQMVPIRSSVHIGGSEFMKVSPLGANGQFSEIEAVLLPGAKDMLDQLAWWVDVTRHGRKKDEERADAA